VAGIGNKDRDWWRYVVGYDFISLSETWVDGKGWEIWKDKVPGSYLGVRSGGKEESKRKGEGGFL